MIIFFKSLDAVMELSEIITDERDLFKPNELSFLRLLIFHKSTALLMLKMRIAEINYPLNS